MAILDGLSLWLRRRRGLTPTAAAEIIGCKPHDLWVYEEEGLLHPLPGDPVLYDRGETEACALEVRQRHEALQEFRRLGDEMFEEGEI